MAGRQLLQTGKYFVMFQYPEGFWPDSDNPADVSYVDAEDLTSDEFQYPEGFWPDSDSMESIGSTFRSNLVSVPRRVLAR